MTTETNMSRKKFIISQGATCKNWNWSWSFVNESERFVIFGAWNRFNDIKKSLIFAEDWKINAKGMSSKGYKQSREHIRLVEEQKYRLMTFPMKPTETSWVNGQIPKIESFTPKLTEKTLVRDGISWYAADYDALIPLTEELDSPEKYPEGAKRTVTVNAYERNPKAREACVAHHGFLCSACDFNFEAVYGALGQEFIHVHHLKPIGKIRKEYEVDPKTDLIPVCPNCHAMIHRLEPALTIQQLRDLLAKAKTTAKTTVSESVSDSTEKLEKIVTS